MEREGRRNISKKQEIKKLNEMEWNGNIEVDLRMAVIRYFLSKKLQT